MANWSLQDWKVLVDSRCNLTRSNSGIYPRVRPDSNKVYIYYIRRPLPERERASLHCYQPIPSNPADSNQPLLLAPPLQQTLGQPLGDTFGSNQVTSWTTPWQHHWRRPLEQRLSNSTRLQRLVTTTDHHLAATTSTTARRHL